MLVLTLGVIYYILYTIILLYIIYYTYTIISYTILSSSSDLSSVLFSSSSFLSFLPSSPPFLPFFYPSLSSVLSPISSSPSSSSSPSLLFFPITPLPIYLLIHSHPLFPSLPSLPQSITSSFILYVSALTYPYLYSITSSQSSDPAQTNGVDG